MNINYDAVYIVGAKRTPFGRFYGEMRSTSAVDLAAGLLGALNIELEQKSSCEIKHTDTSVTARKKQKTENPVAEVTQITPL